MKAAVFSSLVILAGVVAIYRLLNPTIRVTLVNQNSGSIENIRILAGGSEYLIGSLSSGQRQSITVHPSQESSVVVKLRDVPSFDANYYIPSGKQQRVTIAFNGKTFKKIFERNSLIF